MNIKIRIIDKLGDFVINPKFDHAAPFVDGIAEVWIGDKMGYIRKDGSYIWEPSN